VALAQNYFSMGSSLDVTIKDPTLLRIRRYLTTHQSAIWERIKASTAKVTP
jgi:hypothetical protein